MAEKSSERVYTIPLRAGFLKTRRQDRANRSARMIRGFLSKHVEAGEIKISPRLNQILWKRGNSKPPPSVKVKVRVDDGIATARLPDELVIEKKPEKKGVATGIRDKVRDMRTLKPAQDSGSGAGGSDSRAGERAGSEKAESKPPGSKPENEKPAEVANPESAAKAAADGAKPKKE
jgi:large subunit ribosomal protein L31e